MNEAISFPRAIVAGRKLQLRNEAFGDHIPQPLSSHGVCSGDWDKRYQSISPVDHGSSSFSSPSSPPSEEKIARKQCLSISEYCFNKPPMINFPWAPLYHGQSLQNCGSVWAAYSAVKTGQSAELFPACGRGHKAMEPRKVFEGIFFVSRTECPGRPCPRARSAVPALSINTSWNGNAMGYS